MISSLFKRKYGPIGIDVGTRSIKMVQFSADQQTLVDAVRCEIPSDVATEENRDAPDAVERLAETIRQAREGRNFRGKETVLCLNGQQLFLQNLRVPKAEPAVMERSIQAEAAGRIPFPATETEFRFYDAAEVRQADSVVREVIVLAAHRPVLQRAIELVEASGLRPVAVDVEPAAWVRSYLTQFRREDDRKQRAMIVHVGYARTGVVITQDEEILFAKYVDVGGRLFDAAVAKHLDMTPTEARALRRQSGDRRAEHQDLDVAKSMGEACRPVFERLAAELSMCVRYHSVTFRGQPLARLMLGGSEASPQIQEILHKRLDLKCDLSDPLRNYPTAPQTGRRGQWDVAAGLALRELN